MRKLILIVLILALNFCTRANTYYISGTGDDLNSGLSPALAWKTIEKVNSFPFSAGDSILFESGATFTGGVDNPALSNGLPGSLITISSYGAGKATISSGLLEGIFIQNGGNLFISNLILVGSGYKASSVYTCGIDIYIDSVFSSANSDNVTIDGVEALGYGGWGIQFVNESQSFGFNHIKIKNCLLHDNGYGGVVVHGSTNNQTLSVNYSNTDVYIGYTKAYNNYGKSDYTENWTGSGILISGTVNGLIEYCEAYSNGKENGSLTAGPVGIFLGDSKYVTIEHCISHHNLGGTARRDGGGFDLDQGTYGCVIQYCESYENDGAGYGIYQAPTTNEWSNDTIRYNSSNNDGRNHAFYGSITFWGAGASYRVTNAEVYQNNISMSKQGYALVFLNDNLTNVNVNDNVFCLEGSAAYLRYINKYPKAPNAAVTNSSFPCTVQPAAIITDTYRGAFAPSPTPMWTNSWTNYDPGNAAYALPDSVIETPITINTTLSRSKVYLIRGLIYVKNGAVLTIEGGCVIRAEKATPSSALVITKGSKIMALGLPDRPIIFTSDQGPGSRNKGDWSGVFILGKALYNKAGGKGYLDGIAETADTEFGGGLSPDSKDNSGVIEYVRIDYAGKAFVPGKENNGLTLCALGNRTTIDHVQVSFSAEDGFEWIGGSANCSYLVAYCNADENWSVMNGYSGAVQYCLGINPPETALDPMSATTEGIESSNDETGSNGIPYTSALFCNMTEIGPLRGNNAAAIAAGYKSSARFRNNSHLRILNSILMDFPVGVFIDGAACASLANGKFLLTAPNKSPGNLVFRNNLLAGNQPGMVLETNTNWNISKWFADNHNDSLATTNNILIAPYTTTAPNVFDGDYRPSPGSPALSNYNWNDSSFYKIDSNGTRTNLISCPLSLAAPVGVTGSNSICSFGDSAKYYIPAPNIFGVLSYSWTVPAGVTILSGQGTDTIVVKFDNSFSSGNIAARALSYCGNLGSIRNFAVANNKPKLGNDTTAYIICSGETKDLSTFYNVAGYTTAVWNTPTPSIATQGNYQLIVSNANGCTDTAIATIKQDVAFWTGAISKDWHQAGNWSNNRVPNEKTHVIIQDISVNTCEISTADGIAASVQVLQTGNLSLINNRQIVISGKCDPLPSAL